MEKKRGRIRIRPLCYGFGDLPLLLGCNRQFDGSLYLAVELYRSLILAYGLDSLYADVLAVNLNTFGSQSLGYV